MVRCSRVVGTIWDVTPSRENLQTKGAVSTLCHSEEDVQGDVERDQLKMVHVDELREEDALKNPSVRVIASRSQKNFVEPNWSLTLVGNEVGGATFHSGGKLLEIIFV
ncbi:hypothetical protein V6N13_111227 [Hibiscus sabdariffa]